ncbi:hypothetical protein QR46_3057 [Giardia duodenalis assemblage B]|uniref:Uncharacterized protein n=1 Tax=Giardia duodenalis assemblage B TaxID=1394984 RepID=A0A132NS94_GIAIN|nr:hypothetical protein QR46_3057 [Giardia intestinalis assemblage B]
MLVETFALLGSKGAHSGLTLSTASQYTLLKELLERIWEAVEHLHDSSLLFYKGGYRGTPIILQRMRFTEDALIFRLLGSLLKRLDDIYTGRYNMGISILAVHQGNRATCLFTGVETNVIDCAAYRVVSLPTIKSLIGYAHHIYSAEAFNSAIIIRLSVVLPAKTVYVYLVEPPGQFESSHYFDSVAALSELSASDLDSRDEATVQWCSTQDYFTQIIVSTIPTFCYIEGVLTQDTELNSSTAEDLDPEVQLLIESNCEDGTIAQLSWISGIQHQPIILPRSVVELHSPKTILQANIWRQIGGKLPDEALLDLQLYNAYIELDLDIGSKCASRSESPVHLPPCQDSSTEADASPSLPVAIHVLKSLHSSEHSGKDDQLSISAILEPVSICTPSATSMSGALCDSSNSHLSRESLDRGRSESNLSSAYIEATRNFIVTGEELKKVRRETEHLAERLFTMERSNTQQKLAIVSNAVSFWEQFLSCTSTMSLTKTDSEDFANISYGSSGRSKSNGTVVRPVHSKPYDYNSLSFRAKSATCRGPEEAKEELTDLLPPNHHPLIQAIKHELEIYQQLIKVYHAMDKKASSNLLYNSVDLDCPDKIVARFLIEETERHKKYSSQAAKRISSISHILSSYKKSEPSSFDESEVLSSNQDSSLQQLSLTELQAALKELRSYISISMKKVFRDAECVRKSFLLQNEVKVCLYANRKIKYTLDQLKKHFENDYSRTQSARTSRRSSSPSPLESNWRIHASIKAPLNKLMDKIVDVDALTPDITMIASSLATCKTALSTLKGSVEQLMTNL